MGTTLPNLTVIQTVHVSYPSTERRENEVNGTIFAFWILSCNELGSSIPTDYNKNVGVLEPYMIEFALKK